MKVYEKLQAVQAELKAPKGQYNSFGKYKYRSCEDILEALKPVLAKHKAAVTISDDIVMCGERYYIKATASFIDIEAAGDEPTQVLNTAFARESGDKKGLDSSQVTGTASSYARKYALNGLFLIDDTADADTDAYHETTTAETKESKASLIAKLKIEMCRTGVGVKSLLGTYKVTAEDKTVEKNLDKLTVDQMQDALKRFAGMADKAAS
jgi:hypothetical protein